MNLSKIFCASGRREMYDKKISILLLLAACITTNLNTSAEKVTKQKEQAKIPAREDLFEKIAKGVELRPASEKEMNKIIKMVEEDDSVLSTIVKALAKRKEHIEEIADDDKPMES